MGGWGATSPGPAIIYIYGSGFRADPSPPPPPMGTPPPLWCGVGGVCFAPPLLWCGEVGFNGHCDSMVEAKMKR